tara:strand:+ start:140 stop:847 length:708 start_codon:yes stop_codon:yes gene_type:complete
MKKSFEDNGFLVIKNFIDINIINEIKEILDNFANYHNIIGKDVVWEDEESKDYKYIQNINYYIAETNKLITNKLINTVSELLGEDSYFFNMEIHNKAPLKGTITPAHQDNFYFQLKPSSALTAYIPIELHDSEINGGLKFLVGSNKSGVVDHSASKVKAFSSLINLDDFSEYEIYGTKLDAGDIVFHHANTIHFANPNSSEYSRRSFSVRFNGVSAKKDNFMSEKYSKNLKANRG